MNEDVLSAEDIRRIRGEWRTEAEDRLATARTTVTIMQKTPANSLEFKPLMRALHSIKGTSSMVGFREIAEFTQQMEAYCEFFRGKDALPFSHFSWELVESGIHELQEAVKTLQEDRDPIIANPLVLRHLQAALSQLQQERSMKVTRE